MPITLLWISKLYVIQIFKILILPWNSTSNSVAKIIMILIFRGYHFISTFSICIFWVFIWHIYGIYDSSSIFSLVHVHFWDQWCLFKNWLVIPSWIISFKNVLILTVYLYEYTMRLLCDIHNETMLFTINSFIHWLYFF